MKLTNYSIPPAKNPEVEKATGGLTPEEIERELDRGARFVVYRYQIGLVFGVTRRRSALKFLPAGSNAVVKGLPYSLLTVLLGWLCFSIVRSIGGIILGVNENFGGGEDITSEIRGVATPRKIVRMQDLA